MSSLVPFLPPVLTTVDEMLTTKTIPALSGDEMENLCSHLFALRDRDQRITIAEIAYNSHDDPQALNIFLACTIPIAQKMAERRAYRVFAHPTDWQLEAMYDGAITNLLQMFESHRPLRASIPNAFRRYLMRVIVFGTMHLFHLRQENWAIEGVEDVTMLDTVQDWSRNPIEQDVITRELLEQITTFPHLTEEHSRMMKAIAALGPEKALREQSYYWNGRHEARSKQNRGRRAMLDCPAIAQALGVSKTKLQNLLRDTRVILRDAFNPSGTLFAS